MTGGGLPAGWAKATIGDVVSRLQYGLTASANRSQGGPRFLRITDLDAGRVDWSTVPGCNLSNADLDHYRLVSDDIVFARTGSIEKAARIVNPPEAVFASYLIRGRPVVRDIAGWLGLFVSSYSYVNQVKGLSAGIGRANVNAKNLAKVQIAFPPVFEQERIVETVDSYLTRLNHAVDSLERVQAKLKAYRASVLKAAVEGRLVPTEASLARAEKRAYEPAEVLLARILDERRRRWEEAELARLEAAGKTPKDDKWKRRYRDATSVNISELGQAAPGLPVGWCWAAVGQMAWSVKDGPHYSPSYAEEGVPFITGGQVRPWGVDFDAAKRISPEVHRKLSARVLPEFGDLLYTKGGTTGIARVNTYEREFSVWVHVAVLKLAGFINPFYLQHALNSPWCYAQAQRFTHGVGNQDLGLTRMVKIAFPLPPREEQDRIVEEVERLDSIARESAGLVDTQLLRVKRLRQAVLKWAFEGKLIDQDPTDEPADKLLARIRAERVADAPIKKNGSRRAKGAA